MPFSGLATYDNTLSKAVDISPIVSLLAPDVAPILNMFGNGLVPAKDVSHGWLEDKFMPDTLIVSSVIDSATAATGMLVDGRGNEFQVGDIFRHQGNEEYVQVTSVTGPTSLLVSRAYGGSAIGSATAGSTISIISAAALEGADAGGDVSYQRQRTFNVTQIIQRPVRLSGSEQAVDHIGVDSEMGLQVRKETINCLQMLEKAVLMGRMGPNFSTSAPSIGSDDTRRSMMGLYHYCINASATSSVATFDEDSLANAIQFAWLAGARDIDLLIMGIGHKRGFDQFNDSRVTVVPPTQILAFNQRVDRYVGQFGTQDVMLSGDLPPNVTIATSKKRVRPIPLTGRSFATYDRASGGDFTLKQVLGEYTVEVERADAMVVHTTGNVA